MNQLLTINPSTLKTPSAAESYVFVESGITLKDLNQKLDKNKKALATLGAYDGQTLAGAISTGTHGSGVTLGNLASLVRAVVLVSESGTVYQIEPKDGITDPTKFVPGPGVVAQVLKQDDDWFRAALVAMGCLGLIHSYILEVVPAFLLSEKRCVTTWQTFRSQLAGGISSQPLSNRHFEIDINPYTTGGLNVAVTTVRNVPPAGTKAGGSRGFGNWLAGLIAQWPLARKLLVWYLNHKPGSSPGFITRGLNTLQTNHYVGKSFEVLNIGAVDNIKAYAMELSIDANQDIVTVIDHILALFQKAAHEKKWYLAGPVAMRFVKSSDAFLEPQEGRTTMMVEMDMLYGIKKGEELLKLMTQELRSGPYGKGVRVHWGLDLDTVQKGDLAKMYPQSYDKWLAVYKQLNSTGIWNSPFTDRLGISMPMKQQSFAPQARL
ncbi:FAD-dependent oxidoreductase [Fusarium albosuccineum]|uniref:D-arabinono-1,4-lactone oxidase n=1 Tax=Fusarium albosuccineum TaxID=1237068 RepID=A0A8H4KBB7_9HYPO|nr:FAD-dependent oxidoreductase [Fusarium albosuccineum]